MNIFFRSLLIFTLSHSLVYAQGEPDYAVKNIPRELLTNANSVMREYTTEIDITSLQEVNIKEHYAITILNDKGDEEANHVEYLSKLNNIQNISGCIYDENGDRFKKIKQSDFIEIPASMRPGEFSDAKSKLYSVSYRKYPYTVEYTIETKQNHTFYLPLWSPQTDKHCAVQSAELIVTTHDSVDLKYKEYNINLTPTILPGEAKQYKWAIKDIKAEKTEPLSYAGVYNTSVILLAVNDFMLDDYKGNSNSWKDFGEFIFQLNKGRDSLSGDVKTTIRQMVANISDDHEKIKILYAYLQHTMRYVSIQYGIGGWQTLDAGFLSKNQYGDCKALSNYMMAMLSVIGIRSYPVLITAGNENPHVLSTDFVCNQFNHCILCVPFAKDTTWLECTSSDLPANYLSDFTQNRDALMITPGGGIIIHTPIYDTSVNLVTRHADVNCLENGSLKIDIKSTYRGEGAEHLYQLLKYGNDHDKEEYLHSKFHLPNYTLDDYKYDKVETAQVTCVRENAMLTSTGIYTKTGNRSFITLDVAPIYITIPEQDGERKNSFHISSSTATIDTFEITIPDKSDVEYIPLPVSLRYAFGSYSYTISKTDAKLIAICKFTLNSGTYDAGLFENYIQLTNLVDNKSYKKVVLKTKS